MQAIETLRDEHNGVLAVLDHLERAIAAAESGGVIPAAVFRDMEEFFRVFVDRCHHAKEETAVFPAVGTAGRQLVAQLEQEHDTGRRFAREYADAVEQYRPTDQGTVQRLAAAARAYAAFLRGHIALETTALFPLMAAALSADKDAALATAFEAIEEQRIGPGTHERLHHMIDGLGPRIAAAASA